MMANLTERLNCYTVITRYPNRYLSRKYQLIFFLIYFLFIFS